MAKTLHPEGTYKILTIGPTRNWQFTPQGSSTAVDMITYSVQFEKIESLWVDVNYKADSEKPKAGDELTGHIEQDDAGKYAPKFVKAKKGGWGGGGGSSSPGAQWSAAYQTASAIVSGYLAVASEATRKKVTNIDVYLTMVDQIAPAIKDKVDAHAGQTPAKTGNGTDKTETESGESPVTDNKTEPETVIEDIDEKDLGDW